MPDIERFDEVIGQTAYDREGGKIGRIGNVYVDDASGEPKFLTVHTGLFGSRESFVPVTAAQVDDGKVVVAFAKETVKDAPQVDAHDGHLDPEQEREVFEFYGLQYAPGKIYGEPPAEPPHLRDQPTNPPGEQEKVVDEERDAPLARLRRYEPPFP